MVRSAHWLNDIVIRQAKPDPEDKSFVMADGNGLGVVIPPNGRQHFQIKTAAGGTERTIQIGSYLRKQEPEVLTEFESIIEKVSLEQ